MIFRYLNLYDIVWNILAQHGMSWLIGPCLHQLVSWQIITGNGLSPHGIRSLPEPMWTKLDFSVIFIMSCWQCTVMHRLSVIHVTKISNQYLRKFNRKCSWKRSISKLCLKITHSKLHQPCIWCCHYLPPGSLITLGASESLSYIHVSFNLI